MACSEIHTWTISALTSMFFKLVLASILLWVALISFIISQFLGFFGLRLPCSCNDFAEDVNATTGSICLQGALIECPSRMIDTIKGHTLRMFPFKRNCTPEHNASPSNVNAALWNGPYDPLLPAPLVLKGGPCHHNSVGPQECHSIDGEAHLDNLNTQTAVTNSGSGSYTVEEKQVCQQGICCLHCFCNSQTNNSRSVIQFSKGKTERLPLQKGEANPLQRNSQNSFLGEGNDPFSTISAGDNQLDTTHSGASDFYANSTLNKDSPSDDFYQLQRTSSMPELDGLYSLNDLKGALIQEIEARKTLCKELEDEQKAAAIAAEEAMAMISRLQSEKASIEMEARQFKRMVEEKSAYDEEAMEILREILVRLERERFDLQDELQMYRSSPLADKIDKWERQPYAGSNEKGSGYCIENVEHIEDNSTIHDVHVVRTPTYGDPENNVLKAGNSPSISSSCAYENPLSSEQKTSNTYLGFNRRDIFDNMLERSASDDLCTMPMIHRDCARMKVEEEIKNLQERFLELARKVSAISPVEKEDQRKHLEEIAHHLKIMRMSKAEEKHAHQESLPSESSKKSFLAIYSTF